MASWPPSSDASAVLIVRPIESTTKRGLLVKYDYQADEREPVGGSKGASVPRPAIMKLPMHHRMTPAPMLINNTAAYALAVQAIAAMADDDKMKANGSHSTTAPGTTIVKNRLRRRSIRRGTDERTHEMKKASVLDAGLKPIAGARRILETLFGLTVGLKYSKCVAFGIDEVALPTYGWNGEFRQRHPAARCSNHSSR
jgi:hypothetical protein